MHNTLNAEKYLALEDALLDYVERFGPTNRVLALYSNQVLDRTSEPIAIGSRDGTNEKLKATGEGQDED